ncbi:tripartite tricarboxylate transporter TctB family protein [Corynebacterium cystitidis]|uniref:Putative tricarboxylic transport membrane protein n=1 Tax=Corynebacterium cystitidis DSM 20524 TaxID=1121357 RepID=A0A1H9S845_9CORY|nr:tripartite tricarboxylate transporter TctB family protein [Corynebacterium cystitidis]WJY82251.1 Tripartite tricarboxylate transporter TctB family protein [Corynebacterium cystitidis DSM 20524]SER81167.1 putative tricarboxylic transport membrane protein [Corynebacterium cystitidis DSM 20524]SNV77278.1 hypothetical membrane protein [Corynebacterium cystitidis]
MSFVARENKRAESAQSTRERRAGLSEFAMVAILIVTGMILLSGHWTIEVIGETQPGPLFLPTIVGVSCLGLALALAFDLLVKPKRKPRDLLFRDETDISPDLLDDLGTIEEVELEDAVPGLADWKSVAFAVIGFAAIVLLLPSLGWVIGAALLFFLISVMLGSRDFVRDLAIGFIVSSVTYLLFGVGLGLNLPTGFLGEVF